MEILETAGNTPLVHLKRISRIRGCSIHVKLEAAGTSGSAASRTAGAYVMEALESGRLQRGGCIVEACMPNMAIALAQACAQLDVRLMVVMPDSVNPSLLPLIHTMGAEIMLTDSAEGFAGAMSKAEAMNKDIWTSCRLNITENKIGPLAHYRTTGPEIAAACTALGMTPDVFVAAVGTGATLTGTGRYLKEKYGCRIVAVEPAESPVLSGGKAGRHGIDGIGLGFIPGACDTSVIDEIQCVGTEDAMQGARRLLNIEAVCCGPSTGACLHAALQLSFRKEFAGRNIIIMGYDSGERHAHRNLYGRPEPGILLNALPSEA